MIVIRTSKLLVSTATVVLMTTVIGTNRGGAKLRVRCYDFSQRAIRRSSSPNVETDMTQWWLLPPMFCLLVTLSMPKCGAATTEEIDKAVQRGVEYLRSVQREDGSIPEGGHVLGGTALATLALLESDVSAKDLVVTKAVAFVRQNCSNRVSTYEVSLCIMLLDKLGDKSDANTIRQLGVRLRNGQARNGAWTYAVPLEQNSPQAANRSFQQYLAAGGDNSNTQFAVLGLWVARRHGVDVDAALEKTNGYFRRTVDAKAGGWDYTSAGSSAPAMTCAGLLALATHFGTKSSLRAGVPRKAGKAKENSSGVDAMQDPVVQGALNYLARILGDGDGNQLAGGFGGLGTAPRELYFAWSLERVGVIYGLDKVGETNWYEWGAEWIVKSQATNGSWNSSGSVAGTSFSLLFLNRSNIAPDLTAIVGSGGASMKSGASVADLDQAVRAARAKRGSDSLLDQLAQTDDETAQWAVIEKLRDEKGAANSQALADAIGLLEGELKEKARTALFQRYLRMTSRTLRSRLVDGDPETKLAVAKAAAEQGAKDTIPELIELVVDSNAEIRREVHRALCALTEEDFGPAESATTVEQVVAQQRWRRWSASRREPR